MAAFPPYEMPCQMWIGQQDNAPVEAGSSSKHAAQTSVATGAFVLPVFPDTQCAVITGLQCLRTGYR
ncbi:MAG TPA: hypothetical protein VNI52_10175 [Sphingobacteriaceae bacterium]|nr:hypothetical protein [Sphingobacteriaceae bacterium]